MEELKRILELAQGVGLEEAKRKYSKALIEITSFDKGKPLREAKDWGAVVNFLEKEMYGWDDRLDFYQVHCPKIRQNAESVGLLVVNEEDELQLPDNYLGKKNNYCDLIRYSYQPVFKHSLGTGFLIDSQHFITAAHIVRQHPGQFRQRKVKFVRNYCLIGDLHMAPNLEVATVESIELCDAKDEHCPGKDLAVLKLDRPMQAFPNFLAQPPGPIRKGQRIYVLGHPLGLPFKYAGNATVENIESLEFDATLDTYDGNSGSPIFDADTHQLLGVFFAGKEGLTIREVQQQCNCTIYKARYKFSKLMQRSLILAPRWEDVKKSIYNQ